MSSDMPSTYVLIEQSEFNSFLHDLEALHTWARKMVGLSTSITAPAPLGKQSMRSGKEPWTDFRPVRLNPLISSPETSYYNVPPVFLPTARPSPFRRNQMPKHPSYHTGQCKDNIERTEVGPLAHEARAPSYGMVGGMVGGEFGGIQARPMEQPRWQAPVRRGPHRTPNITRAPDVAHTPQRGVRYVRRPRRVRPERDVGNAEPVVEDADDAEDDEYVVEEDEDADVEERSERS